jgi:DNA primase
VRSLKRFVERVYLCFDSDSAGDKASRRGIEILEQEELDIKVIELTGGTDIDECLQKDKKCLEKGLKDAVAIYDFYLNSALKRFSATDPFGKKKISDELLPLFAKIPNNIVRSHYLQKLAGELDIDESAIFASAKKFEYQGVSKEEVFKNLQTDKKESRYTLLNKYLLTLTLQKEDLTSYDLEGIDIKYLEKGITLEIWEKLRDYLSKNDDFSIPDFYAKLEPEEIKRADEFLLFDLEFLSETERVEERKNCIYEIKKLTLKNQQKELKREIKRVEAKGDDKRLEELNYQFRDLSQKIKELSV